MLESSEPFHSAITRVIGQVQFQDNWVEIMKSGFMIDALIGGLMVALVSSIIGYFVVLRRDTFAAHSIGHIGFPGATLAALVGVPPVSGLLLFCLGGAAAIGLLGKRLERRDVATGTTLAFATALGILFASFSSRGQNSVTSVLFGNMLAISRGQLVLFGLLTILIVVVLAFVARPLLFTSVNPEVAEAKGVRVRLLGVIFLMMLAIVTTMAVQVVGTLLLFALLVTPISAALAITARTGAVIAIAIALATLSIVLGLTLAAMFNLPPSFFIVSLTTGAWLIAWLVAGLRRTASI